MSEEGIKKAEALLNDSTRRARRRRAGLTDVHGKKPGRDVVFARNTKADIANAQMAGYSVVLASENKDLKIPAADQQPDGSFVLGDTIAMEIPAELRKRNREEDVRNVDRMIKRTRDTFHEEGRKAGVQTFEEKDSDLAEAEERKTYEGMGKKLFAMGATFDDKGNLVHQGKTVVPTTSK